jgi:hypothetical protein
MYRTGGTAEKRIREARRDIIIVLLKAARLIIAGHICV